MPHYELKPLDMANILTTLVDRQSCKYNDRAAVYRRNQLGQWLPLSWAELAAQVSDASYALEILGVKEQQKLAVFSPNDPDIIVTDLAAFANRAIPVSIYATSSEQQVEYIVRDSGASIIFTGNAEQYAIARRVAKRLPSLQRIVTYDTVTLEEGDNTTMTFEQLLALGKAATEACRAEVERRKNAAVPEDIATLLYTSGTTGDPKGAILPSFMFQCGA